MDKNQFIVQAALELIINLSHCEKMQEHFNSEAGEQDAKVLHALFNTFYNDLKKMIENKQLKTIHKYNNPLKKIGHVLSIMVIHGV
jgi:hypothetical protein